MKKGLLISITLVTILGLTSISYAASSFTPRTSIEEKKEILEQRVEEGVITEDQADEIEAKLENCDGTRQEKIGQEYGVCFGQGNGQENGQGQKYGQNAENRGNGQNAEKYGNQRRQNGKGQNQDNANCNGTGVCRRVTE